MEIIGYKGFNKDLTNRYGKKFEIGKKYYIEGSLEWGTFGNGYHMCTNLEDCLRFIDPNISVIAKVKGFGQAKLHEDDYYGYYDMYVCEGIEIIKILSRKEIISMMLKVNELRQERFIKSYNLTEEELKLFKGDDKYGSNNSQWSQGKQLKKYRHYSAQK